MKSALHASICFVVSFLLIGCQSNRDDGSTQKLPRPVSVLRLVESNPGRFDRVTGSVASWKTEQIGFEVSGRVQFVIEPETDIEGETYDEDGSPLTTGTVLAKLDESRYQLHVNSVKSQIDAMEQQKEALRIEVVDVIPAEIKSAEANLQFATSEFNRIAPLHERGAVTESERDKAQADRDSWTAKTMQLEASRTAKVAEQSSMDAQIQELEQSLAEAERDVEDCQLYSPYRGQVAEVHVIPGAYVERGQPVVTVQMMHPIKVEFEASAATVRSLQHRDMLPIYVTMPDGSIAERSGMVYMTDPVADPQTRTFTVTLLVQNEKTTTPIPEDMKGQPIVRTRAFWRVLSHILDDSGAQFVEERSIRQDDEGHFLWEITNRQWATMAGQDSPKLNVEKVRITRGDRRVSFLGIWTFREIAIDEGEDFDQTTDVYAGALEFPSDIDAQSWAGGEILLDQQRWLLRPGELVGVDLGGGGIPTGFYVPVDAITEKSGVNYVFVVESADADGEQVRSVQVHVRDDYGTLRRIEAAGDRTLEPNMQIVAAGAAFLTDGEAINVAEEVEVRR